MGKMYRRWDKFEVQDVIARKLSRREWFAGMALQGIMASNDCGIGHIPEKAAQWAVRVADAICRELDAPEE